MATMTAVTVGGSPMEIYFNGPPDAKVRPAILLMYHRGGLDGLTKSVAQTLVDEGYRVAVPDVSHRISRDIPMPDRKKFFRDSEVIADMGAAVAFLRSRPDVDRDSIAIIGHCMGGRMAFLGAGAIPGFRCVIVFYGGGVMLSWGDEGTTPFDRLGNIRCPVIGFFGDKDTNPSPENVRQIEEELRRQGVPYTFHRYPLVGHGFQNPAHDAPEERAAGADSWIKVKRFLRDNLPVGVPQT